MNAPQISVSELQSLLERGAPVRVLDIREEEAHREWKIPGSEHLSWSAGEERASETAVDCDRLRGDAPLVVVCARGRTSLRFARAVRERCGVEARSLAGGMAAWSLAWNSAPVSPPGERTAVLQLRRTGKGCLSYLVASEGDALVIDPSLAPEVYLEEAEARSWRITGVLDTHLHADHVSRGRRLADTAGVPFHLPRQDRATFPYRGIGEGERIRVGATYLTPLHTPGHTDESHSFLLDERYLFTGDTLFLDAVGRPDLEARGDEAEVRRHALLLFHSLSRLVELGSDPLVLPAHASEPVPFDGRPVAAPLGAVKDRVEELRLTREEFVARLLQRMPPAPANYERIVELNEAGELPGDALLELEAGANRCAAN